MTEPSSTQPLQARGLGCALDPERWLVRGLDLQLEPGTVTVVVGPNGSGKTTLLRTLMGLRAPQEGEVELGVETLARVPLRTRAKTLAWLPQRTDLPWGLPVERLVMLGRAPHLPTFGGPRRRDHAEVGEALRQVGAEHLAHRDVRTLSGGERQRVLLARLLATRAPTLVLDEPCTALDIGHALRLLELARALASSGHALLVSMHELDLARRYGDTALLLRGGTQGEHLLGPASEVLQPTRIAEVFKVDAKLVDGELRFAPEPPES